MGNPISRHMWGIILILLWQSTATFSLAFEVDTHQAMNDYIAKNTLNNFSFDAYLKSEIGFHSGTEAVLKFRTISKWMALGGRYEDLPPWTPPYIRSVNHFHDPLSDEGFTGIWGSGVLFGQSSIKWALAPQHTQVPGGFYSWSDVRNYYYQALTSEERTTRDQSFVDTFRGLGQLMHLVQDASVPAHSRDDGHYIFSDYEAWLAEAGDQFISRNTPIFFSGQTNDITSLIDTNQYHQPSPDPVLTNSTAVGLSEYSNANFFSEGTILDGSFPYPNWSGLEEYEADIAATKKRIYLRKIGDGERIEHAAAGKWFYRSLPNQFKYLGLKLDSTVYSDYAALLIPRAIGYSAGLLHYFFRDHLGYNSEHGNTIKIINESDEDILGTFALYYDNKQGTRQQVAYSDQSQWSDLLLPAGGTSQKLEFQIPSDAMEVGKYMLVFRGVSGAEQDAVIGRQVQLQPPFVFVVQEKASFGPPVVAEYGAGDLHSSFTAVNLIGAHNQLLSGRFETYGAIQSIAVLPTHPVSGITYSPRLTINDHELSGSSWASGDTADPPLTWKVSGLGDHSQGYYMRVVVSDGMNVNTIDQLLLSYPNLIDPSAPRNVYPFTGPSEQYAVIQYQIISVDQNVPAHQNASIGIEKQTVVNFLDVDAFGLGSNLHLSKGHWNVIKIDGTPSRELPCPFPDGGNDGECRWLGFTLTHPASVPVAPTTDICSIGLFPGTATELKGAGWGSIDLARLWPGLVYVHDRNCTVTVNKDLLSSGFEVPLEPYLPYSFDTEVLRAYTDDDLAYFHSLAIDPPVYSVVFE